MAKNTKPAIRFRGFTDAWEQSKLGEITESYSGGTPTVGNNAYYDGDIPFIRSGEISGDYTELFITSEGLNSSSAKMVKEGDILYALYGATSGEVSISKLKGAINQAILAIQPHQNYDNQFLMQWLKKSKKYIIDTYLQGGQGNLSGNIVKNLPVDLPTYDEQHQIGAYFKHLDNLITLHQRKYDSLVNVKKAMLEKMFPKNGETVPEIRFKGFTDAWEQRKLSGIYQNIGNAFVGTATPYYVEDGHFYLESNNIKDGQINRNSEIFINDEFYEKQKDKWLHTGDMVMVQSGHVGHAAVIPEELDNSAAHALIMFRNQKEKVNPYFLNYQYQTNKAKKKIEGITTGNTIKHILASDMQEFVVDVPDFEEQEIIGAYFQQLDNLITLHQRKLEKLKNIKKSCLEKMFV